MSDRNHPLTLEQGLTNLGMEQYIPVCQEAHLSWDALTQLPEADLENLNIMLGHRRKLQRAFARGSSWPDNKPLPTRKELQEHVEQADMAQSSSSSSSSSSTESLDNPAEMTGISSSPRPTGGGGPTWNFQANEGAVASETRRDQKPARTIE